MMNGIVMSSNADGTTAVTACLWRKQCINTEHSDIVNKWSTFHTFTIYWGLWETVAGSAPADLYFVPMPARNTLPPNANFSLSDWSYWSSALIYVSGVKYTSYWKLNDCNINHHNVSSYWYLFTTRTILRLLWSKLHKKVKNLTFRISKKIWTLV